MGCSKGISLFHERCWNLYLKSKSHWKLWVAFCCKTTLPLNKFSWTLNTTFDKHDIFMKNSEQFLWKAWGKKAFLVRKNLWLTSNNFIFFPYEYEVEIWGFFLMFWSGWIKNRRKFRAVSNELCQYKLWNEYPKSQWKMKRTFCEITILKKIEREWKAKIVWFQIIHGEAT